MDAEAASAWTSAPSPPKPKGCEPVTQTSRSPALSTEPEQTRAGGDPEQQAGATAARRGCHLVPQGREKCQEAATSPRCEHRRPPLCVLGQELDEWKHLRCPRAFASSHGAPSGHLAPADLGPPRRARPGHGHPGAQAMGPALSDACAGPRVPQRAGHSPGPCLHPARPSLPDTSSRKPAALTHRGPSGPC